MNALSFILWSTARAPCSEKKWETRKHWASIDLVFLRTLEQKTVWNKGSVDIAEPQEDIQEGTDYHVNFQDSLLDSIHFSY